MGARKSPREILRTQIRNDLGLKLGDRQFGEWLAERLNADGTFPGWLDRRRILSLTKMSARTFSRRMAALGAYFTRHHVARRTGLRTWIRRTLLSVAADLPKGHNGPLLGRVETRRDSGVDVSTRRTGSRNPWAENQQRKKDRENWPILARARSDVPMERPGYGTNARDLCRPHAVPLDRCWLGCAA